MRWLPAAGVLPLWLLALPALSVLSAPASASEVVVLDFSDGLQTITFGERDDPARNVSSIGAAAPYPPFVWPSVSTGVETRAAFVARIARRVHEIFLPYDVIVRLTPPPEGPYTRVLIGGLPRDLGLRENYGGVAYMDCGNQQPSNLVFAFPGNLGGSEHGLVVTIAQEAAHAFGLEHTESRRDLMHPILSPEQASFLREETTVLGDRICGPVTQNSHGKLIEMVGAWPGGDKPFDDGLPRDRTAPSLVLASPGPGSAVTQPFVIALEVADDGGIDRVVLTARAGAVSATAVLRHAPFRFDVAGFPAGPLDYTITAVDRSGNQTVSTGQLTLAAGPALPAGFGCEVGPRRTTGRPPPWATLAVILGLLAAGRTRSRGRSGAGPACTGPRGPL